MVTLERASAAAAGQSRAPARLKHAICLGRRLTPGGFQAGGERLAGSHDHDSNYNECISQLTFRQSATLLASERLHRQGLICLAGLHNLSLARRLLPTTAKK